MSERPTARDLPMSIRMAVLAVPVIFAAMTTFTARRIGRGEWNFDESPVVVVISVALLAPGLVAVAMFVRSFDLYALGVAVLCCAALVGLFAALLGGGDGQAGVGLLMIPALSIVGAAVIVRLQVSRASSQGSLDGGNGVGEIHEH